MPQMAKTAVALIAQTNKMVHRSHTEEPYCVLSLKVLFLFSLLIVGLSFKVFALPQVSGDDNNQTKVLSEKSDGLISEVENDNEDSAPSPVLPTTAQEWIQRLSSISSSLSYEVSYVVSAPNKETLPFKWRHAKFDNGDVIEQLSLLNGPGYEQIRINNKISVFEPGFSPYSVRAFAIDGPIPRAFLHEPSALYDAYDVLLMGRDRISGRMSQQIRVISKDQTRYGYHLWLDEKTGMLLKLNMYDLDGRLLEQIQITQVSIGDSVKSFFENIQSDQMPPVVSNSRGAQDPLPWTLSYLPIGMRTIKSNLRRVAVTGQAAEYMMLSDGLVDVSVYVTTALPGGQDELSLANDSTSLVSLSNGRIQVTVVGEVPISTADKIANSIVLSELN